MVFPLHAHTLYILCALMAQDLTYLYVFIYFLQSESDISVEFPSL